LRTFRKQAMTQLPNLALGSCLALALATGLVEVLRTVFGPTATLQNMRERALSWWILLAIGVPMLMLPSPGAVFLFGGMAAMCITEFLNAAGAPDKLRRPWLYLFLPLVFLAIDRCSGFVAVTALGLGAGMLATERYRRRLVALGVGVCVVGLGSLTSLALSGRHSGTLLLLAVVVTQASDAMQYVFGKLFGSRRMAPRLSPSKTWEGLVGGVACAVAAGTALAMAWNFRLPVAFGLSSLAATTGVVGGLLMSALKRHMGVKDWGSAIKGHGGVLDRVDSLLLTGPVFLIAYILGY
jgi:phosphatidate cytidylyltransferase